MAAEVVEMLTFDVEQVAEGEATRSDDNSGDWRNYYKRFIDGIRTKFFPIDDQDPHQQLLIQKFRNSSITDGVFLDIVLQTQSHKIRVRIGLYTFEIIGYQMETKMMDGTSGWLEFGYDHSWRRRPPKRRIPGSSFLEFKSDFSCMFREVGEGQDLYTCLFGQRQLITAVNILATSSMNHRPQRAWSLLVVGVMICEAVKYTALSNHFISTFPLSLPLFPYVVDMLNAGLADTVDSYDSLYLTRTGKLIWDSIFFPFNEQQFGFLDVPHEEMPAKQPGTTTELLEVFSVRIININGGKSSGNFFGTISFRSLLYNQPIYNRGENEGILIHSGENLLLNGPNSFMSPAGIFGFCFDLFGKKILSPEPQIGWDSTKDEIDTPLSDEFANDDCSLMLSFIVLTKAVQATVEVTIKAAAPVSVYGKISAYSSMFDDRYEIVLFQKTHKEHLEVCPNEHLKLSRSVVAVPLESSLLIQVDLFDYDSEFFFVKSTVDLEFPVELCESSEKKIDGDSCGGIVVKVTWT